MYSIIIMGNTTSQQMKQQVKVNQIIENTFKKY